jgi:aldehyde:ferredoxin oxidoreductase
MLTGYAGKLLRVNLTANVCTLEDIDPQIARKFIGGAGYSAHLLYTEVPAKADPLGPDNKIIFSTSPLSENIVPGGGSVMVCFKSPQTNAWGESRCGGNFGPDMRRAGVDFIVVEGKSDTPKFLSVINGCAQLHDAGPIAGKTVYEKTDWLEENILKDVSRGSAMTIGLAGENMVKFSSVMLRDRAAGRGGGGAVLGSKKLLAVCVGGNQKAEHGDKKRFSAATRHAMKTVRSDEMRDGFHKYGTMGDLVSNDEDGDWPTKNWKSNSWGKGPGLFDTFQENNLVRANGCYSGCPIACGRIVQVKEGPFATPVHEGGEYESISAFTAFVVNKDMNAAVHCDYLCNGMGMDTISSGAVIGFAMECMERNLLPPELLEGLDLEWGNPDVLPKLLKMICNREGLGDLLADGVKVAAQKIGQGASEFAVHVKGLEGPAHDGRSGKVLAVAYGTANRGMCHIHPLEGMAFDRGKMDWGMQKHGVRDPETVDRWDEKGKGTDCALLQDGLVLPDILTTCKFMSYAGLSPDLWLEMLNATTGWDMTEKELIRVGSRTLNLQRLFNVREGLGIADDQLPSRVKKVPEFGAYKDTPECGIQNYDQMLKEYYECRGWDPATGIPNPDTLEDLGLSEYAEG